MSAMAVKTSDFPIATIEKMVKAQNMIMIDD
jgi:hypothetical protein